MSLDPAPLPKGKDLRPELVQMVQGELERRTVQAAEAQKSNDENQRRVVEAENLRYLREVTARVGWIDARRFGAKAASQGAVLAQNSLDILLMLAALPHLERDLKPLPEAREVFSSFHDSLQVAMGGKQLYATQIAPDVAGEPVVLPLEKRTEVDAARRKLGLPPLPETLATLSREVFQGRPVRIAEGEVVEAPPAAARQAGKVPVKSTSASEPHPSPNRSPSS